MNHELVKQTHEPVSLLKILGRTTTHVPRVYLSVEVGLGENITDFVNSRFQFSVLEYGRGFVGRVLGHGGRASAVAWGARGQVTVLVLSTRRNFPRDVRPGARVAVRDSRRKSLPVAQVGKSSDLPYIMVLH